MLREKREGRYLELTGTFEKFVSQLTGKESANKETSQFSGILTSIHRAVWGEPFHVLTSGGRGLFYQRIMV